MGTPSKTIWPLFLCLVFISFGTSQEVPQPSLALLPDDSAFTISKNVDEVNLILSVTDSKGRFVGDLTADDLRLLDNHQAPGKWNYFQARTNLPLRVILAVDISSSIRERFHFEQQAAGSFLKHVLRPETDEAGVVAFGSQVEDKTASMTSNIAALNAAIDGLRPGGETAMYDAIIDSCHKLHESRGRTPMRPVIILITDGADTAQQSNPTLGTGSGYPFRGSYFRPGCKHRLREELERPAGAAEIDSRHRRLHSLGTREVRVERRLRHHRESVAQSIRARLPPSGIGCQRGFSLD